VRDVHPEAADPPVQPETQDVPEHRRDAGVTPVPVRLAAVEQVQVPLAIGDPGPGLAAEPGRPVVRRLVATGATAVAEQEQVPFRAAGRCGQGLLEQRVLDGAVIRHQVDDHPDAAVAGLPDEVVEVGQRAEPGIHGRVVADVVTAVVQRRRVERGQPDRVHAQRGQVVQAADEAGEVADSVAVVIGETARVHLVHDCAGPPLTIGYIHSVFLSLCPSVMHVGARRRGV
jgi:hypothetical protein